MAKRQTLMARALTEDERSVLEICAKSDGYKPFTERRSRIILASAAGDAPLQIAAKQGIDDETVRRALRAFNEQGLDALFEGSRKPKRTGDLFVPGGRERLMDIFRRNPKDYGYDSIEWTLELIADAAFTDGLTKIRVSDETIRTALLKLDIRWIIFKRILRRDSRRVPSAHRNMITIRR